jgi:hypothetical protein
MDSAHCKPVQNVIHNTCKGHELDGLPFVVPLRAFAHPSRSPEMTSSGDDPRETPLGVVSRWQQLASMDRHSPEFVPLLASLTTEENRSLTMGLCGANARDALSIMDEVSSTSFTVEATTHVAPLLRSLGVM